MSKSFLLIFFYLFSTGAFAQSGEALDGNAVGGMYSGKIQLIQNTQGMGVNSQKLPQSNQARLQADGTLDYNPPPQPPASKPVAEKFQAVQNELSVEPPVKQPESPQAMRPINLVGAKEPPQERPSPQLKKGISAKKKVPPREVFKPRLEESSASIPTQNLRVSLNSSELEIPVENKSKFVNKIRALWHWAKKMLGRL